MLVLAPDFESVDRINSRLAGIGNLRSDGRPILGLDAKEFVKIVIKSAPGCIVIPAHIWTPWFSLFGANSGFDTIEECFEDMTPFIFAMETGLSSDPPMNWAHSPSKIGREANVFNTDFSFKGLTRALRNKDPEKFLYTVEFFPEEGKYHYDGHRKCDVIFSPRETIQNNYLCPRCGKKLTIGVLHRVEELADREPDAAFPEKIPYRNLIPLNEIIGQAEGKTAVCKGVWDLYFRFIHEFGDEHTILTETPVDELKRMSPEKVAAGIRRMRNGKVKIIPGHDGCFGKIDLFSDDDDEDDSQLSLF
jgi:uncharacterized protein (TIGR00375 family)